MTESELIKMKDEPLLRDNIGKPLHHQNLLSRTHLTVEEMDKYMLGDEDGESGD
jgi:hypothetical protein